MTPLERAARAAAEQYGEDWDRLPDLNPIANGELDKDHFFDQARAVIAALRIDDPLSLALDAGLWNGRIDAILEQATWPPTTK